MSQQNGLAEQLVIDVDMIGNKFEMEFATRRPIEFFTFFVPNFSLLSARPDEKKKPPCATAHHQKDRPFGGQQPQAARYYGSAKTFNVLIVSLFR
jgi:hypothetical protein